MKCAIVTFVIGKQYQEMYELYFKPSVEKYCKKYDIDLILITEPFNKYDKKVDLCCQKLLIPSREWADKYDALCWLEADILISPSAPNIFENVTDDKILFVNPHIYDDKFYAWKHSYKNKLTNNNLEERHEKTTAREWFKNNVTAYRDEHDLNNFDLINEGVVVFQPRIHGKYLEDLYNSHDFNEEVKLSGRDGTHAPVGELWWYYQIMLDGRHRFIDHKYNVTWNYYRRIHLEPFDDPQSIIIPTKNYIDNSYFCHIGDREYIELIHFVEKTYFRKPDTTLVVKCGPIENLHWIFSSYIRAKEFKDIFIVCKDDSAKQFIFTHYPRIQYVNFFPHEIFKFVTEVPNITGRVIECDSDWVQYKDFQYILELFHEDKNDNDLIKVVNN